MNLGFSKIERGGRKTVLPKWCVFTRRNAFRTFSAKNVVRAAVSSKEKANTPEDAPPEDLSGGDDDGGGGSPPISLEEEVKKEDPGLLKEVIPEEYPVKTYLPWTAADYNSSPFYRVQEQPADQIIDEVKVIGAYKSIEDFLSDYEDPLKRAIAYDEME